MTVVGWDHNLTFGVSIRRCGPGRGAGWRGARRRRTRSRRPAADPLVTRFEAVTEFKALETQRPRGCGPVYAGGAATASLERSSALLAAEAGSLLDASTLATEQAAIAAYFD